MGQGTHRLAIQRLIARSHGGEVQFREVICAQSDDHADDRVSMRHSSPHGHDHSVQFYDDDTFLAITVSDFVRGGLVTGQPVVVIATSSHQQAFAARLRAQGVDVRDVCRTGQLRMVDAHQMLSTFMVGGLPDAHRFGISMGRFFEECLSSGSEPTPVRAYGEMVDLLWKEGNAEAALRLEDLWNALADSHDFSLLCAYAMDGFPNASDSEHFGIICDKHTRVMPPTLEAKLLDMAASLKERDAECETLRGEVQKANVECQRLSEREGAARAEAERAHADAVHARIIADQATRVKREFLAVMSHELRTPLNAIGGYAELMELGVQGPISEKQRSALERIQRSQRLLLGLINQMLSYARIETGNIQYQMESLPVDETLRTIHALFLPQLHTKKLRYTYTNCSPDVLVHVDEEKLHQIVLNLLTNAVKFTASGGHIGLGATATDNGVMIQVCDTGIGIAENRLSVIFDPFVQVDTNYTRTQDGVGLGLAISRDLARGMGGDLTVESVFGKGSVFTLTLLRPKEFDAAPRSSYFE